jgi:hypothetical protein
MGTFRFMVRPEFLSLYILMEDLAQILLQGPNVLCFIQQFGTSRRVNGKCTMSFKGLGPFFHVPNLIVLDAIQERQ